MEKNLTRELIYQDNGLLAEIRSDLNKFLPALRNLKSAYEELEMGEFTSEAFEQLKRNKADVIIAEYRKGLNAQLDKSGVTNTKLRATVLQGAEEPIHNLQNALTALKEVTPRTRTLSVTRSNYLSLSEIAYENGQFKVQDEEYILETYCRVYLDDEKSKDLHTTLNTLKDALEDYFVITKELAIPFNTLGEIGHNLFYFLKVDYDTCNVSIEPSSIKWATELKAKMQEAQR